MSDAAKLEIYGTVLDAGGGELRILVDRDTPYYPVLEDHVRITVEKECPYALFQDRLRRFPVLRCILREGHDGEHHHGAVWVRP